MAPDHNVVGANPDLYAECRKSLETIDKNANRVLNVLMNIFKISVNKTTRAFVYRPEEKFNPEFKKETVTSIMNALAGIMNNVQMQKTGDTIVALNEVQDSTCKQLATTIIDEVKKAAKVPAVSYAEKLISERGKPTESHSAHTLVIKTNESLTSMGKIKERINLRQKKIKLARSPFIKDSSTIIMNFDGESDLEAMKKEVENPDLLNTKVYHQKKLLPTIRIFDIQDTSKEQLSDALEEMTGGKSILISCKE